MNWSLRQKIEVIKADITTLDVVVIVNAANERLEPGCGVCGAIHKAVGPDLAKECSAIGSYAYQLAFMACRGYATVCIGNNQHISNRGSWHIHQCRCGAIARCPLISK